MEEEEITDAANNNYDVYFNAVAVVVHNVSVLQVPLPSLFLPVGMHYVGSPPSTRGSTLPVETIVGVHMSNLEISNDSQYRSTVQPKNEHTMPPKMIIAHNTDSSGDD